MEKKVLIDRTGFVKMTLQESSEGRVKMRGEFGKADVPTENRRIYPKHVWKKEIDRIQESIKAGKVFGHIEHPANGKTDLSKVSHIMTDIYMEEDGKIIGEAVILNNEHGKQLKSILEAGGAIGVSSRGMGSTSTNKDGFEVVSEDFNYITHDFVADPAVKTSYPSFVAEGASKVANIKEADMKVDEVKPVVESYSKEQVEEMIKASTDVVRSDFEAKLMAESTKREQAELALKESSEKAEKAEEVVVVPQVSEEATELKSMIESKDSEISRLKSEIDGMNKKFSSLEENVVDALNGAKRLAIQLEYERESNQFGDSVLFRKMLGEAKNYENSNELRKAVIVAKSSLLESRRQERISSSRARRIEESLKLKVARLETEVAEKNKSLEENLVKEKEEMAKIYAESRLMGNPNAPKLRRLVEGITEKSKIDEIISQYTIATPNAELYNSIRSRFEGLKGTALVESQLEQASMKDKTIVESVDDEIKAIIS
jgi:hypothetical protein